MMKSILLVCSASALSLAAFIVPAQAQQTARVVTTCGSVSPYHALNPGSITTLYVDPNGNICGGGGGGGGGGTSSNFGATFPTAGTAAGFEYLSAPPTLTSGQMVAGQTDVNGNIKVSPGTATLWGILTQGSTTSGQSGQLMMGAVTTAAPSYTTAQTSPLSLDTAGNLRVNVVTGGGSGGTSAADKSAFTYGTTTMTTGGCVFNSSITALTSGQAGGVSCSANREQYFDVLQSSNFYTLLSATVGTPGSAIPTQGNMVGGTDGTNFRDMGVDAANNVKTATAANVTPTDCSGTITTGGIAQPAIAAQTTLHGFTIGNIDASAGSGEPLWISFTATAAASTAASYPLAPPAATTFAGMGSYSTPPGFGTNHAVSIIGATTGHKFSCSWW